LWRQRIVALDVQGLAPGLFSACQQGENSRKLAFCGTLSSLKDFSFQELVSETNLQRRMDPAAVSVEARCSFRSNRGALVIASEAKQSSAAAGCPTIAGLLVASLLAMTIQHDRKAR